MATEELVREIKQLIIDSLHVEKTPETIDENAPLFQGPGGDARGGLGLDSIDALELAVAIERKYRVTIPDEKVGKQVFASVAALADYVAKQR